MVNLAGAASCLLSLAPDVKIRCSQVSEIMILGVGLKPEALFLTWQVTSIPFPEK